MILSEVITLWEPSESHKLLKITALKCYDFAFVPDGWLARCLLCPRDLHTRSPHPLHPRGAPARGEPEEQPRQHFPLPMNSASSAWKPCQLPRVWRGRRGTRGAADGALMHLQGDRCSQAPRGHNDHIGLSTETGWGNGSKSGGTDRAPGKLGIIYNLTYHLVLRGGGLKWLGVSVPSESGAGWERSVGGTSRCPRAFEPLLTHILTYFAW